jgi:hypothetical protein
MSDKLQHVFFYGLFMDERVLRDKGVQQTVVATFEDGSNSVVTTFNLQQISSEESFNADYAAKLRSVLERLGFPVTI